LKITRDFLLTSPIVYVIITIEENGKSLVWCVNVIAKAGTSGLGDFPF